MSCNDNIAISINGISKFFEIYEKPVHRLLQMLFRGKKQFYRPFWALTDISFTVNKGECVGIIGRNGAGKSTLLQIVTGTLTPSAGEIRTRGRVAALLELGSGFNPEFTGKENVYLNASILGLSKQEIDVKYKDIIAFADIGEFIDQPVKSYSSGMMMRLAFAVIAHVNADVLIVDEALSVGDAFFTQKCMRFLRRFIEEHTVLFVSHDVAAVNSLCNRAVLLESGRVKITGSPKEVTENYLEDMFASLQSNRKFKREGSKNSPTLFQNNDEYRDMRQNFINTTQLRNDIKIFRFNENGASFGNGGAVIKHALLTDHEENPLSWVIGGELVTLHILCKSTHEIINPIIGFNIKDRLGQAIMGDNTYLSFIDKPLYVPSETNFTASFTFRMPILAAGDYSFAIAVAEGTQNDHIQHQWRHDAIVIKSISTSVQTGIMGIPMQKITLNIINEV